MGKLAPKDLQKMLNCIRPDPRVVVPPLIGYDSGVHKIGDQYLVVAADPAPAFQRNGSGGYSLTTPPRMWRSLALNPNSAPSH
jgi:hypothetical protein